MKRPDMTFNGYCKTIGLGTSRLAITARIVKNIKGSSADGKRKTIESLLASGKITDADYASSIDRIDEMGEKYEAGFQTHRVDVLDATQWKYIGGGYVRKNHIRSSHNTGV